MFEKLSHDRLRARCCLEQLNFTTTEEVAPLEGLMGQDRAVQSLAFGLRIKDEGYNVYIMGMTGTGRNSYTASIVKEVAEKLPTPDDWCYVYDFKRPDQPMALSFKAGEGTTFKESMSSLIETLKKELPKAFEDDAFKSSRQEIIQGFQEQSITLMAQIEQVAKENQLLFKPSGKGYITVPIIDGQPATEAVVAGLDAGAMREITERVAKFSARAEDIFAEIRAREEEAQEKLLKLEHQTALAVLGPLVQALQNLFGGNQAAQAYFEDLQSDILKHIKNFWPEEDAPQNPLANLQQGVKEAWDMKYKVNLVVDNKDTKGAPVVREPHAAYYNLMGMIEMQHNMGVLTTDFTRIKAGAIHRANGGFLILEAEDLFSNALSWKALKRALKHRITQIENVPSASTVITGLKPAGIPLNVKVLIIGSYEIYRVLYQYEEDFKKLFKVKVDFETEMTRKDDYIYKMAAFISKHCQVKGLRHFTRHAVSAVVDYSSRLADNQGKLSTRFNDIVELLAEANIWADIAGSSVVHDEHVEKALEQKRYRSDKYEQKIHELIEEGTYLISTEGHEVGQINGLAVYNLGDYSFGRPSRITVNTFAGKSGVINIEKEAQMSGPSHNKGVHILSGYLGKMFAQKFPLTLTATLCFEQSYDGIDGDSASSTELYALLSSLSDIPLDQGIAVTGSVNQKGEIQPIGGANEKIEGFFRVAKRKGLTGKQGVLIPHTNVKNLMLDSEVISAVAAGTFHIWSASTIEQGIELLTGVPAGVPDAEGAFPVGTVFHKVATRLERYYLESLKDSPRQN
ncbi:MAG: AAA family ATPase [Firmicutes bacterium]|nr:AAA family ATPase [Dethiobacter sp.]MBS3888031.1 AAA family ATPase [Bacillota bacterium]MBS4055049.1 AAA family ATPase [Thermaerobacter sp.]